MWRASDNLSHSRAMAADDDAAVYDTFEKYMEERYGKPEYVDTGDGLIQVPEHAFQRKGRLASIAEELLEDSPYTQSRIFPPISSKEKDVNTQVMDLMNDAMDNTDVLPLDFDALACSHGVEAAKTYSAIAYLKDKLAALAPELIPRVTTECFDDLPVDGRLPVLRQVYDLLSPKDRDRIAANGL